MRLSTDQVYIIEKDVNKYMVIVGDCDVQTWYRHVEGDVLVSDWLLMRSVPLELANEFDNLMGYIECNI